MAPMRLLGIVLVVLGIVGLSYGRITWKQPETVVDLGPVKVTHDEKKSLELPPIAGGLCLAAGAILLVGRNRRPA